jgi:hypothetical protein
LSQYIITSKDTSDLVISLLSAAAQSFKYASADASAYSSANFPVKLGKDSNGDVWLRSFLINSKKNAAGWSVDPETIHQNVKSIEGRPFVLYRHPVSQKISHPVWSETKSAQANDEEHQKYALGYCGKPFQSENGNFYVDVKVVDPLAKEFFEMHAANGSKLDLAVSPQILRSAKEKEGGPYRDWKFQHLAVVEKNGGAYGPQVAKVLGSCSGNYTSCGKKLETVAASASAEAFETAAASASTAAAMATRLNWCSGLPKTPANGKPRGRLC